MGFVYYPVQLIAGVPGTFLVLVNAVVELVAGTVPYTCGASDEITIQLGSSFSVPIDASFNPPSAQGFLDQPESMVSAFINGTLGESLVSSAVNSAGVYLTYGGGAHGPTSGNGTLRGTVTYNSFVL
jgi:hypothetical protein